MAGVATVINLRQLVRVSTDVAKVTKADVRPLLETLGATLESQTRARFGSRTAPDGTPWKPWSDRYAAATAAKMRRHRGRARRSKQYVHGPDLLVRSGKMRQELLHRVLRNTIVVGSPAEYAPYHQDGTPTIPARPFLGISTENEDELRAVVSDFYARLLHGGAL